MGLFFSKLYQLYETFGSGEPARIVMLGLDAAGNYFDYYLSQLIILIDK